MIKRKLLQYCVYVNVKNIYNTLFFSLPSPTQIVYSKSCDLLYCIFCDEHDTMYTSHNKLCVVFCKHIYPTFTARLPRTTYLIVSNRHILMIVLQYKDI